MGEAWAEAPVAPEHGPHLQGHCAFLEQAESVGPEFLKLFLPLYPMGGLTALTGRHPNSV